jgi:hypothetical protein
MSEFTWLNKQGVRSDQGFEVQRTGRWTMEYREGAHAMQFSVAAGREPGTLKQTLSVRVVPFPGWAGDPLTDESRRQIIENISRALIFKGYVPLFYDNFGKPYSGGP